MSITVPTWEEAMEEAKKRVGRKFTMVPIPDSPSQGELEDYARKHIATLEEMVERRNRCHEGQNVLHSLIEGLTPELQDIVYEYLYDVTEDIFVDKLKSGGWLD